MCDQLSQIEEIIGKSESTSDFGASVASEVAGDPEAIPHDEEGNENLAIPPSPSETKPEDSQKLAAVQPPAKGMKV